MQWSGEGVSVELAAGYPYRPARVMSWRAVCMVFTPPATPFAGASSRACSGLISAAPPHRVCQLATVQHSTMHVLPALSEKRRH